VKLPQQTPLEFLAQLQTERPDVQKNCSYITEQYLVWRYRGEASSPVDLEIHYRQLSQQLRSGSRSRRA